MAKKIITKQETEPKEDNLIECEHEFKLIAFFNFGYYGKAREIECIKCQIRQII